jgi:DNA polymerase-3 subunit delta'
MFATIPTRLDGTGAAVVTAVRDVLAAIDAASEPITRRHEAEIVALDERVAASGERGSGRKQLEERHRREQRRHRTDELRSGLAVMAGTLRDALVDGHPRPDTVVDAIDRIHQALEALERNPNETLLLQRLLLQIPSLPGC